MRDERKTKAQLIKELAELRQQVAELKAAKNERQRAEETSKKDETLYWQAVEHSPNPIFLINKEGLIRTWNRACEKIFQYDRIIIGQPYQMLLQNVEDQPAIAAMVAQVFQNQSLSDVDIIYRCKDGTHRFMLSRLYPLLDHDGSVHGCVVANTDITERKRTEQTLADERNLLWTLIDNLPDFIFVKDTECRFIVNNIAHRRILRVVSPDEIVGKTDFDFFPEKLAAQYFADDRAVIQSGLPLANREEPYLDPTGNRRWLSTIKVPLRDSDGEMMGLVGMSRDITERKRAEEALRQKVDEQAALYEASQVFLDEVGVQAILQKVCRLAVEHFGLRMAWVGLVDKDSFNVSPASICGFEKGYLQSIQVTWDDSPYGQGPIGTAIRTARPAVVNQIETDPTFAPWRWPTLERGYRALASLPLYYVQEVLGVLNVYSAETEYFTPDRLQVLQSFANLAAVALRKARLYEQVERHTAELEQRVAGRTAELTKINEQLQREIAERKQVEKALRESEERYRTLFEQANDAIFLQTEDDQIIDVNQRACEMLGYTREELLTMTVPDLQAPEIRQGVGSVVKQELDKYGSTPFETTDIRRDGKRIIVEISLSRVTGRNGGLVLAIIRDITERKRAEAELERLLAAEREQRLLAETLREVTLALTAQTSHGAVLDEILRQAQQLVPCNTANIMLLEEDNLRMARWKGYETFGIGESISGLVLPLADFPLDTEVVQSRKALALPDVRQEPRWTAIDETAWIRSHITVPICQRDRVLGLLQLDSDAPGEFSAGDIQRLQPLASAAAIALENAHLYEQALQDAETKLVLLHEVNHRVKNNLAAIIGLLYAERSHASMKDKAAFQTIMRDLIGRVRGMATVHSLLSASEWTPLPLNELASRVIHASLQALPSDKHVFVDAPPSPALVTPKQANSLALVINELATNTVKYALSDQGTGRITVRISLEDGAFALEFRDNGPGYPPEVLQFERFNVGMHLVQAIVQRELRGEVAFHNDQGAVAIIRFKSMAYPE